MVDENQTKIQISILRQWNKILAESNNASDYSFELELCLTHYFDYYFFNSWTRLKLK